MKIKLLLMVTALIITVSGFAQGLKINPGTTFKTTGSVNVIVQNSNILNNGNGDFSAANVYLTGGSTATIGGAGNISVINLYIDKASSTAILGKNVNVSNNVVLVNGLLDLNGNTLTLAPSGSIVGETETNHIIGASGGVVSITLNMDAPLGDNPGNLGALIASTQDLGLVTIKRGHDIQKNNSSGKSIARYYSITPTNNNGMGAILRFKYLDAELNGLTESTLDMWKSSNNGTSWQNAGASGRNTTLNFVDLAGVNTFIRYTLSSSTFSLVKPIGKLEVFEETTNELLSWSTPQGFSTSSFTIEKSLDSIQWHAIGSVPAKETAFSAAYYSYYDNEPTGEKVYYRVQAVDNNSVSAVTNIVAVSPFSKIGSITLTPNPIHAQGNVTVNANVQSNAALSVFATDGRLISKQQFYLSKGLNQLNINVSTLAAGMYYLVIEMKDGTKKNIPFIKQ